MIGRTLWRAVFCFVIPEAPLLESGAGLEAAFPGFGVAGTMVFPGFCCAHAVALKQTRTIITMKGLLDITTSP